MTATRTGAQILVDQLRIHGADTIYSVPGESFLAVLDVLHDTPEIRLVTCRQEGGGAMMFERSVAAGTTAIIELRLSVEQLSPSTTISALRQA